MDRNTESTGDCNARRQAKFYIYRYKDEGIYVTPSRSKSKEACWDFVIRALRPATIKDDKEAERLLRKIGEVVRDDE